MHLEDIDLRDFRNYDQIHLNFDSGINIFIGENAQGKTSLLEAIYYLALVRSHRTSKDRDLIKWQADFARLEGRVNQAVSQFPLEIVISKKGKKVKVNHLDQRRLSDYIGHLNVVLFAPEDLELIKGAPQLRRKFIDMELSQVSAIYLYESVNYQHLLKQRNEYLKKMLYGGASDMIYLEVITEQLATSAAKVVYHRLRFVDDLLTYAAPIHANISQKKEVLTAQYHSGLDINLDMTENEIKAVLLAAYQSKLTSDRERGTTSIGPHRDDLHFKINGKDLQKFGSQGQQRTTVLSLKLAEIEYIAAHLGEYPILLLDDVLSELDDSRQTQLLAAIDNKVQTFLTTTSIEGIALEKIKAPKIYRISGGQVNLEL
ncbi:DNA replication/repair protein RecF [Aerococcus urinaehominis]|uniref:DNA replication and repair protein RecF n=1 Tax=Aerococcus urinaehominis TaxID=128944 RepID=A0A0X8FL50_9LACT|nr:DNA replication/repair protein RecF [Aerococcus urinaehominis]AMB99331.1 DNA replication/repair protein RecF [Aerococcus urinaehominis]SDM20744.1 DNA replication and repair protein RecF [Aerococcus urinaehominis]